MKHGLPSIVLCLGLVSVSFGQGTLQTDTFDVFGQTFYLDSNFQNFGLQVQQNAIGQGQNYSDSVSAPYSGGQFAGVGAGSQNSFYTPGNPGIGGNFGIHTSLSQSSATVSGTNPWEAEYSVGSSFGYIQFSVSQSTQWSIAGNAIGVTTAVASGVSQAAYRIRFSPYLSNIFIVNTSLQADNGVGDYNLNFSYGGVLTPGSYSYEYFTFTQHGGSVYSPTVPGGANTILNSTLTLTPVPEPSAFILGAVGLAGIGLFARKKRRRPRCQRPLQRS